MSSHLLMIEDDARLAQMVGEYLGQSGLHVTHRADGKSGLAQLQGPEAGPLPDLVIASSGEGIDHLRRAERAAARSTSLDQAVALPTAIPDAETTVDAKHRLTAVLHAIDAMPPKRRAVFVMFKFEHKSYLDISRELNISIKTVENHLTKAMSYCRAQFEALDASPTRE